MTVMTPSADGPRAIEPIVVTGRIERGDQRGRRLGVPTANVAVADTAEPADGVYAGVFVRADGSRWPTAVSIGRRPSFHPPNARRLLEAHLIGFTGDLYGEEAEVHLLTRLRPQRAFVSADDLIVQLRRDIRRAAEAVRTCAGVPSRPG